MTKLTATQLDCIALAKSNHNKLIRYKGSNWAVFNADIDRQGFPYPCFRHATVKALVARGLFEFSDYGHNPYIKRDSFMSATLTEAGLKAIPDQPVKIII